jgi:hypothetical protein
MPILLFVLPAGLALSLGYRRYLVTRAMRHVSIEVACLSLDQVVDIGTRSSTSMVQRAVRRPRPSAAADGAVEWRTQSQGGVMLYRVLPLPDYLGFRVESWATTVTIARMQGSHDLLRTRRRTLEAISRAGQPVPAPAFAVPPFEVPLSQCPQQRRARASGLPLVLLPGNCLRWRHESVVWSAW